MEEIDSEHLGCSIINPNLIFTYFNSSVIEKQWVAKIGGIDSQFGFKREFLKHKEQRHPTSKGWFERYFELGPNMLYQYKGILVDGPSKQTAEGYFAVRADGKKILTIEYEEVRYLYRMPIKKKTKLKKISPGTVSEDVPF